MMLRSRVILSIAAVFIAAGVAGADVKKRWELDFKHDRPQHYTYRSPMGNPTNFWYMTYTVTNNTPQAVPLIVDVALHVDKRNYQQPGFYPIEETDIIGDADGLHGYSVGIQKEIIEDLKKRRKYLSKSDLRKISVLQPGESVHCLAIFEDKQYRYNDVEVLVSGLVDPVTYNFDRAEGNFTPSSQVHLRYENRVFRLTYSRQGDHFQSYARGLELKKHDWIVVGVNPAVTKDDIAEITAALVHEDPLVRRIALDLLTRYTTAAKGDLDLSDMDDLAKVEVLKQAKDRIIALAGVQNLDKVSPVMFTTLQEQLISRIPPIPQELLDLKLDGGELNSDQVKDLCEKLKVVIVKAQENKCPTPGSSVAVLTRMEPTSQAVYDWICGYKDPSTGILYHGIQQWKEFINEILGSSQVGAFRFADSLFECLNYQGDQNDEVVRGIAISVLKDIITDDRMIFDVSAFDPKKTLDEQDPKVKDGVLRWREWWSRNRDFSYWDSTTKAFTKIKK